MIKAFWFVFWQSLCEGWKHTIKLVKRRRWITDVAEKMPPASRWSTTPDTQVARVRLLAQQNFDNEKQREFRKNVKAQEAEDAEREIEMAVYANFMKPSVDDSSRVAWTLTEPVKADKAISGEKLIPDIPKKK